MSEANNISVRIKNKFNPISVWDTTLSDHILLSGEIAYALTDGSFKIKIGDGVSPYSELPYFTNAVNISEAKYALLIDEDAVDPDIIYIVSADYINAYGQQMKNLADGTDLSDAVTYGQLSTATSEVKDWVLDQLSDVGSDFKTETISATNSIWEVQPNTRAIFNANVSNGDTIILKDYSIDNKYQLVLSSNSSTSCQVQLLVEDNNAAYAHATISPAFKILSPGQRYDATILHDSFTLDDDNQQYAVRSIVPLSVGGYGYATTEYNAYLVDNSINNINLDTALTSTPTCNLLLPAPQVVNNDAKARAFYASTNISASLQLPEFDVVGNALTYRYGDGKLLTALEANQPYYFVETKTNEFSIWKFGAGSGSGGEALEKYLIVVLSGELSSGVLHYYVEDCTIATIEISSSVTPVAIHLPPKPEEHVARDFILRVEISSSTAPTVTFTGVDEELQYDSDDSDWAVLEPGLNFISFTETK